MVSPSMRAASPTSQHIDALRQQVAQSRAAFRGRTTKRPEVDTAEGQAAGSISQTC